MDSKNVLTLLGDLLDLFRKELKNELKDLPPLRQKDFQVLEYIWTANPEHSVRMSDLTQFMEVSTAATSKLINSYEMQEIAQRVLSTEDRRGGSCYNNPTPFLQKANFVQIHPTLLKKIEKKMDDLNDRTAALLEYLGPEDAEALERILKKTVEWNDA